MAGKQLLVAEDDYVNKLYIEETLKDLYPDVLWAKNGIEAVDIFKKQNNISLVLMDIRMPVLDRYNAA